MKSPCSNQILKNYKLCARLSIVSAFLLSFFSAIAQDANTAAIASDVESILQSLNWALRNPISSDSGYIPERLDDLLEYDTATYKFLTGRTSTTASINYNDRNALPYLLGSVVYGLTGWAPNSNQPLDYSLHGDLSTGNQTLSQVLSLLQNISNVVAQSASTVVVSNYVSFTNSGSGVVSSDILAGNPWWATNSVFVASKSRMDQVYPVDSEDFAYQYSFPEFMSMIASKLNSHGTSVTQSNLQKYWYNYWGKDAIGNWGSGTGNYGWLGGYTWFDWISDTTRSNLLASATYNRDLLMMLRNLSNEVNDSSAYIANHLDASLGDSNFYLSNIVNVLTGLTGISPDILAGNPWWSTNSAFAPNWSLLRLGAAYPDGSFNARSSLTFPEAFSLFLSSRTADASISGYPLWYRWGVSGQNYSNGRVWTFEDWLADYLKSNLVLTSVSSYSNLLSDSSSSGATMSDDDTVETNALDELTIARADTSAIGDLTSVVDSMGIDDAFSGVHVSSADPVLRIFDGGQYGSVRVAPVDADFSLPQSVANLMKSISKWLWRLLCVVSIFCIVRQEFDFWSTLGGSAGA